MLRQPIYQVLSQRTKTDLWFCDCMTPGEYGGLLYTLEYDLNKYLGLLWLSFITLAK